MVEYIILGFWIIDVVCLYYLPAPSFQVNMLS